MDHKLFLVSIAYGDKKFVSNFRTYNLFQKLWDFPFMSKVQPWKQIKKKPRIRLYAPAHVSSLSMKQTILDEFYLGGMISMGYEWDSFLSFCILFV